MPKPYRSSVCRQIQILFQPESLSGLSDAQLVERFLARRDESAELAFTALVERHGPMVMGVCRRILADSHDAEDAFQATFLILVRKARSVRVEGSIGRWLYGVATRVAARGKARTNRREARETGSVEILVAPSGVHQAEQSDLREILASELGKLPLRSQMPVVLCDLEGLTHEEAARRLGVPAGTIKSRLSRARGQLRTRLARRGLTPAELFVLAVPSRSVLTEALVDSTVRAARSFLAGQPAAVGTAVVSASVVALTQGVIKSMFLTKLKVATAALLLVSTGALLVQQATTPRAASAQGTAEKPMSTAPIAKPPAEKPSSGVELDVAMLERSWLSALERSDRDVVDRILADGFEGVDPAGRTFAKDTYLQEVAKGAYALGLIEPIEIAVRSFGDTAVLTSRIRIKSFEPNWRYTKVYVKRQGRWQCVAWHVSMLMGMENMMGDGGSGMGGMMMSRSGPPPEPNAGGMAGMMASMMGGLGNPSNSNAQGAAGGMMGGGSYGGMMQQMMRGGGMRGKAKAGGAAGMMAMMGSSAPAQAVHTTRIRPRFECLVEKVYVEPGQQVKKGDPLADLFSAELARAKNEYLAARVQKENDQRNIDARRKLVEQAAISAQSWLDTQNAANKSNLAYQTARDNLLLLGLNDESIDLIDKEAGEQKARMTLRAPVDGTVSEVSTRADDLADTKRVLIMIEPNADATEKRTLER
jgi:RNA polymerase sigma factor (sigma-70 family)